MQVKIKMKEQVNIFKDYDLEWGHFVVALVDKEISFKDLVEREFGSALDGVGAIRNLTFTEKETLNKGLRIVKERLARISSLVRQGEKWEDIKKMLEQQTMVSMSARSSTSQPPKNTPLLKTKSDILKHFNVEELLLEEAVELVQNTNHRLCYKYAYGIGTKRLLKEKILDTLEIDAIEYKTILLQVQLDLSNLIKEALKNRKELGEYKQIYRQKEQLLHREQQKEKIAKKADNGEVEEKIEVKEDNAKVVEKTTKKGRKSVEKNFLDYFVLSSTSSEEREKIYQIICYFIENYVFKDDLGYMEAREIYGNDLLQESNEKDSFGTVAFYNFIAKTKKYVEIKKSHLRPVRFVAYFTSPNMSEEERKQVEEQVYAVVQQIPKKNSYYQIGVKGYGEDLKGDYVRGSIETKEGVQFLSLIQTINKCLELIQ